MKPTLTAALALITLAACGETPLSGIDAGTKVDAGTNTVRDAGTVPTLNGCAASAFVDRATGDRTITFGSAVGLKYSPSCMIITAGQSVTFSGDFGSHPLVGGEYMGTGGSKPNPVPSKSTGTDNTVVTFPTAGLYPYYCNFHASSGMTGAIWVQ